MCSWGGSLRYRSGGGRTQSQNELTVEELRSFVTQLDGLPCVIRQAPLLKVREPGSTQLFLTVWSDDRGGNRNRNPR